VATPESEAQWLAVGRAGTAEHVERLVRAWRRVDRKAELREAAQQHASRSLQVYPTDDGTVQIQGRLAPEVGALLLKALAAARQMLDQRRRDEAPETDPPTAEQQQADALALLAEAALHHELDPGAPGERYQVVVHVDAAVLAQADQPGQSGLEEIRVSAETAQRLACDASRVVMQRDAEGRVVEVGARTRTIPPALRRALQHREGGCQFPGCGVRFGQGHHLQHWAQGGPTTLRFLRPDGGPLPAVPPPPPLPWDPVGWLRERHRAAGLCLHCHTATPAWLGERFDVRDAIDVLHPRAR
jgi:hypothetical protein